MIPFLIYLIAKICAYCCWCTLGVWWLRRDIPRPWKHGLTLGSMRLVMGLLNWPLLMVISFLLFRTTANTDVLFPVLCIIRLMDWASIIVLISRLQPATPITGGRKKYVWLAGGILISTLLDQPLKWLTAVC